MPFITGGSSGGGGGGAISGVTITGTAAAGNVPVASSSSAGTWAVPPGGEIGYDQITTGVNILGSTEGTATTVITCAAHTFDGGAVIAQFFSPLISAPSPAGGFVIIGVYESGTLINRVAAAVTQVINAAPTNSAQGGFRFTPTAASHTYTVAGWASSTTGTPSVGAGAGGAAAQSPAWIRFVKV